MKTEHVIGETLTGGFPPLIPVMSDQVVLESMVTHLVRCTCDSVTTDCPKNNEKTTAEGVHTDFTMKQRDINGGCRCCNINEDDEDGKNKKLIKWDSVLKDILARCPRLCTTPTNDDEQEQEQQHQQLLLQEQQQQQPLKQTTIPLGAARWRESNDRQVLAPLDLQDNILAGNLDIGTGKKRKCEFPDEASLWIPNKLMKIGETSETAIKVIPCSVIVKRAPLNNLLFEYKNANKQSCVKLYDFFKEVPQTKQPEKSVTKNDFMNFLCLDSKDPCDQKQLSSVKTSHPTKLTNFPQIPFSSDYGRLLLARERHCLPQEVALRKIDRMEWYLKGARPNQRNSINNNNHSNNNNCNNFNNYYFTNYYPEFVVYDRKVRNLHLYKFPKRQFHQKHEPLYPTLARFVLKPVCVHLERMDITYYLEKMEEIKRKNAERAAAAAAEAAAAAAAAASIADLDLDNDVIEIITIDDDDDDEDNESDIRDVAEMICIENEETTEQIYIDSD